MDTQDIWGAAPEVLPAGGTNNAILQSASSVVIFPEAAFENALVDAVASSAATAAAAAVGSVNNNNNYNINNNNNHLMSGIHLGVNMAQAKEGIKLINNNLGADAQYLRAKMQDAGAVLERDIQDIGDIVKHRGELGIYFLYGFVFVVFCRTIYHVYFYSEHTIN